MTSAVKLTAGSVSQQEQSDLEDSRYVGTSHGTSGVSTAIDL